MHLILLSWNALEYTEKCLNSLAPTLRSGDSLTIVDNGSERKTVDYLKELAHKRFKRSKFSFKVLYNDENLGFVKGVNQAIDYISQNMNPDHIVLINNDLEEFPLFWLSTLENELEQNERCAILGVKQYLYKDDQKKIMHFGAFTLPTFQGWPWHGGQDDIGQCGEARQVDHVNFACVAIKKEFLEEHYTKFGYHLCPEFHSYCEDDQMCLEARQMGWEVWVTPSVEVLHHTNVSTRENKTSRDELHRASVQTYTRKNQQWYDSQYHLEVGFHSLAAFPTGYATAGRNLVRQLDDLGVKVNYSYLFGTKYAEPPVLDDIKVEIIRQMRTMLPGGIQIVFGQGDLAQKNSGDYKICYTMLEIDTLPRDWVVQLNTMDEVWVPSEFNKRTFFSAGVNVPIYVMPLGIDPAYFHPNIEPLETKYQMPIDIISVGEWGERKNFPSLILAHRTAFAGTPLAEKVGLTIRYTNNDALMNPSVIEQINRIPDFSEQPHVRLIKNDCQIQGQDQEIPSYKMGAFYRSGDIFVLPTSGEGYCLPALEALACGIPVIITGWSAHVEALCDENGDPLPGVHFINYFLGTPRAKCPYYGPESKWAHPDIRDLALKLQYVVENLAEEKKKAIESSKIIREKYSWRKSAEKIVERLKEINEISNLESDLLQSMKQTFEELRMNEQA